METNKPTDTTVTPSIITIRNATSQAIDTSFNRTITNKTARKLLGVSKRQYSDIQMQELVILLHGLARHNLQIIGSKSKLGL